MFLITVLLQDVVILNLIFGVFSQVTKFTMFFLERIKLRYSGITNKGNSLNIYTHMRY